MRRWGIVVSISYAVIVCGLLLPGAILLVNDKVGFESLGELYQEWATWIPVAMVVVGQASLLFVSVDTSWRRLKPRAHLRTTCYVTSMLLALLTFAGLFSLAAAVYGDGFDRHPIALLVSSKTNSLGTWLALWLLWGVAFSLYVRNQADVVTRGISWLLKGSVLELLIAVPCHVIVRRRDDCSAPVATSFGITTGIAIMLLSFGPSVLLLYHKRMERYAGAYAHPRKKVSCFLSPKCAALRCVRIDCLQPQRNCRLTCRK